MLQYVIDHLDHDFAVIQSFVPENLHFTINDEDISTIEYEISKSSKDLSGDPVITGNDFISPKNTHWQLRYGPSIHIMGGVHTSVKMSYGGNYMSVSGSDWMWYLDKRFMPFDGRVNHAYDYTLNSPTVIGVNYEAIDTDLSDILTAILDMVLSRPNSLPITYSLAPSGLVWDYFRLNLADTTTILEIIKSACAFNPGRAFQIAYNRVFSISSSDRWYGIAADLAAGDDTDPALIWVIDDDNHPPLSLDFTNLGPEETHIQAEGEGTTARNVITLGNVENQEVYWRTDKAYQLKNAHVLDTIEARAHEQFAFDLNPVHEIPLSLDPDIVDKQQAETNYVSNGGFETNTTGWSAVGTGATITRVTSEHKFGAAAGKLHSTAVGHYTLYTAAGLTADTTYELVIWIKVTVGIEYRIHLGSTVTGTQVGTGDWQKRTIFRAPSGTTLAIKVEALSSGTHDYFIDGVSLINTDENDGYFWTNFKPGRALWIDLQLIAHHIDSPHHIVSMDCNVAPNGSATVALTENQIYDTSGEAHVEEG